MIKKLNRFKSLLVFLVGWLVVLRIHVAFSHMATWNQEITNIWNSSGETGNQASDLLQANSLTTRPPPLPPDIF